MRVNPSSIVIVTTTLYPKWYKGEVLDRNHVGKIRGDLALEMIKETVKKGYRLIIVDGGSSEEFRLQVKKLNIRLQPQSEPGKSAARRQAIKEASRLGGVKVICWVEPEKASIIGDFLVGSVLPILHNEADLVILSRKDESFATYPDFQTHLERKANRLFNNILREKGLLSVKGDDLDVWFGPKFFKNKKELVCLFLEKYKNKRQKVDNDFDPELWFNTLVLPVICALYKGFRVKPVYVSYVHPKKQTRLESGNKEFILKRKLQFRNLINNTEDFIRDLERR